MKTKAEFIMIKPDRSSPEVTLRHKWRRKVHKERCWKFLTKIFVFSTKITTRKFTNLIIFVKWGVSLGTLVMTNHGIEINKKKMGLRETVY